MNSPTRKIISNASRERDMSESTEVHRTKYYKFVLPAPIRCLSSGALGRLFLSELFFNPFFSGIQKPNSRILSILVSGIKLKQIFYRSDFIATLVHYFPIEVHHLICRKSAFACTGTAIFDNQRGGKFYARHKITIWPPRSCLVHKFIIRIGQRGTGFSCEPEPQ